MTAASGTQYINATLAAMRPLSAAMGRWYVLFVTIRVVLAEDNTLLREGITRLIGSEEKFELVGVGCDYPELIELVATLESDVVVTDIHMPPTGTDEGIRAASWLREHQPNDGVVDDHGRAATMV